MVDFQKTVETPFIPKNLEFLETLLETPLQKISPFEDHLHVSEAHFVPEVDGINFAPHPLTEHPEAVFDRLIAAGVAAQHSDHISDRPEAFCEVDDCIVLEKL